MVTASGTAAWGHSVRAQLKKVSRQGGRDEVMRNYSLNYGALVE